MAKTAATRIDEELYASAQLVAPVMSRSAAQQIAHWARIGREIEASGAVSHRDIEDVLAGRRDYDDLSAREQAVVRAQWTERMRIRRESLDLTEDLDGLAYVEADDEGRIIERDPATA